MNDLDLCYAPAIELGNLIGSTALSPVELTDVVLRRIELLNPRLNAYLTVTADLAMDQARASERRALRRERLSALDGVPCSVKDLEPCANVRTTYGSAWFRDNVSAQDGIVATRLKASGAILLGKTNTPAFGHKDTCDNLLGPPCVNPWDVARTSGGSSGGAGAALAAGLGPLAQGSDAGGSIRIPAALCGVVGLKPSQGRVPLGPTTDYWGRTHIGPMARTTRDAALLLSVLSGRDSRDPISIAGDAVDYLAACDGGIDGLRVAWSSDLGYAAVRPEVRASAEAAAIGFKSLGCEVGEAAVGWFDPGPAHRIMFEVLQAARFGSLLDERPEWIDPSHREMIESGRKVSGVEHMQALLTRTRLYDEVHRFFEDFDLLLTPQMPLASWIPDDALPNGMPSDTADFPTVFDRIHFTIPFNLTGLPAISVPCGFTSGGLPIGLQIVGRPHDDALVLRAAAAFEAMSPWAERRPPLNA